MRKSIKISLTVLLMAVAMALLAFAGLGLSHKAVMATAPETFEFESGAYVKVSGDGGMRFRLKMDATTATTIKNADTDELSFYVIPNKYIGDVVAGDYDALLDVDGKVHAQKVVVDRNKIYFGKGADLQDGYFANCLLDINLAAYANAYNDVDFIVVAKWGENVVSSPVRSLYGVANACALSGYLDEVMDVYSWLGTEEYKITVSTDEEYAALVSALGASAEDYTAKYIYLNDVIDSSDLQADYTNASVSTYTVSVAANNGSYGSVNVASVASVPYGTVITTSENTINVNGTVITASVESATEDYT